MKVHQNDLVGEISGFPLEVVQKMVDNQVEQGNKGNVTVFQRYKWASESSFGFDWNTTKEKTHFWKKVILEKDFKLFFEKYPKLTFPRVMEVSYCSEFSYYKTRVVFTKKQDTFIAWATGETIEESEKSVYTGRWLYAREVQPKPKILELTIQDISEGNGVGHPAHLIHIKK